MATCPVCQSNIEITAQHFGTLYTCPKCSAVFFVDWNGNPEAAEVEEPVPTSLDAQAQPHSQAPSQSQNDPSDFGGFPESISGEAGFDPIPGFSNVNQEFSPSNGEQADSFSPSNHYQFEPANQNSDLNPSADLNSDLNSTSEPISDFSSGDNANHFKEAVPQSPSSDQAFAAHSEATGEENSNGSSVSSDIDEQAMMDLPPFDANPTNPFAEISDFGNSDVSQGAFSYSVFITGVDSAAVRASLLEALSDKKFGWEVETIMSQMKGGALTIRSVSAVKASILIQRIKYLPIQVSWRQDVLSTSV